MDLSNLGKKILWLDTETTGVDTRIDDVVQIAVQVDHNDDTFQTLVQPPDLDLDSLDNSHIRALDVSGITVDQLKSAPSNYEGWCALRSFLRQYVDPFNKSDRYLVAGYNVKFDIDILRTWWHKRNDKYFGSYFYPYVLDVMVILVDGFARSVFQSPPPETLQLGTVIEWAGIAPPGKLHDAMTDVLATRMLYNWILERRF